MRKLLLSTAAIVPLLAAAESYAQIDEIVVTSQKREQLLINVPMSVTALTDVTLEQRGIDDILDISLAVPGLVIRHDGPGTSQIFLRGVGNLSGSESLTGVYLDETPVTLNAARQLDLRVVDLERVEILKGPQGTLFGQGSTTGTVRFITKDAVLNSVEGSIEGQISFIEQGEPRQKLTGVINLPIVEDVLALRIAATAEKGGGWIDQPEANIDDGNNQDLQNIRFKALWQATDKLQIKPMIIIHRNKSDLGLSYEEEDRTVDIAIDPARELIPREYDYELYNLTATYDLGFAEILSSTSYIDNRHSYPASFTCGSLTLCGSPAVLAQGTDKRFEDSENFTQELRITSTGDNRLDWTVGGFYRNADLDFNAVFDSQSTFGLFTDLTFVADTNTSQFSIFGDTSFEITDKLEIGAGVRYFRDKAELFDGILSRQDTFTSVDPRAYVSYEVVENWRVYFNFAKGFRSGGFNQSSLVDLAPYDPETVLNYEIGTKASVLDGMVNFELAAFYSDYKDMLRRGLVFSGGIFQDKTDNIGGAEIKGVEGTINIQATDQLALNFTGAWTDAEVTEVDVASSANLPGDPIDYVAEFAFTAGAVYDFQWLPDVPGFVRLDYSYRDDVSTTDRFLYVAGFETQASDSVSLFDARIGAEWDGISFEIFGKNLTDENSRLDPFHQFNQSNRTQPRTIGLKVGYDFD